MVRRALVIFPRCIGDTLLSTPLLRQLARLHREAHVHAACSGAGRSILEHNPHIDQLSVMRRGRPGTRDVLRLIGGSWWRHYDLVIDTHGLVKTALVTRLSFAPRRLGFRRRWPRNQASYTHALESQPLEYCALNRLRLLQESRLDPHDLRLDFPTSRADQQAADRFRSQHFRRPVAAIYPATTYAYRQWPLEKFAALGKRLVAEGFQVLVLHGPGERAVAHRVGSAIGGDTIYDYPTQSLPVMKETLSGCALFVGHDGGPKHVANASGIPTVSIFSTIAAEAWTEPDRPNQRFVSPRTDRQAEQYFGEFIQSADRVVDLTVDHIWPQIEALLVNGHVSLEGGESNRAWFPGSAA